MRKVITIPETESQENQKPVEFTHYQDRVKGWCEKAFKPTKDYKVVYLGKCDIDGDMFAVYRYESINIYKGHLNSGMY